jgi:hypothetical protein
MTLSPEEALSVLPDGLRSDLIGAYQGIVRNYRERRWEPAELNGGKLCEAVYTVIRGRIDGSYPLRARGPRNMIEACRRLEQERWHERSIRIQIPKILIALYEIRNQRGVGHNGAEVNPNHMDAMVVIHMSKWLVAELVRVLHSLSTDEATKLIDALVEREVELVWSSGDIRRVLKPNFTLKQKTLLLLLSQPGEVKESDLLKWIEQPSLARFRRDVLRPAHRNKLVELDEQAGTVALLPPGVELAEALVKLVERGYLQFVGASGAMHRSEVR